MDRDGLDVALAVTLRTPEAAARATPDRANGAERLVRQDKEIRTKIVNTRILPVFTNGQSYPII